MTQDELMYLQQGRVPAEPILALVAEYCERHDRDRGLTEHGEMFWVAERAGVSFHTLITYLGQRRVKSLDFNTADNLLCACGLWERWYTDFADYYVTVDLNWRQCECPGCFVMIHNDPKSKGPKPKWCSASCASAGAKIARGVQLRRNKRYNDHDGDRCRNGHERKPENQLLLGNGKVRCRECQSEANARAYSKRKSTPHEALLAA